MILRALCRRLSHFEPYSTDTAFEMGNLQSVLFTINKDRPGALQHALSCFVNNNLTLTHIESRPASLLDTKKGYSFIADIEGSDSGSLDKTIEELKKHDIEVKIIGSKEVPWFPRKLEDLDLLDQTTLNAGSELESDHPGFKDEVYKKRRHEISEIAKDYKTTDPEIPRVTYTQQELETWKVIYNTLTPLHRKHACEEFNESFIDMEKHCGYGESNIPQLADISNYLINKTGFRLKPITGLLSARDFLNSLALRVFASTQYIRHHSVPFYTPEPDLVHELLGHAPMFANPDFADFSQEIGLASLGVSDEEIKKLATCYWFSVEFGVLKTKEGKIKAYGAGNLSSVDEILNCVSEASEKRYFDPRKACQVDYPITKLQPIYWYSHSFAEAKEMMANYAKEVPRAVTVSFDRDINQVRVLQRIKASK